ncbi:unnamed protein product [Heligmosomoides polygyrus]|uniref:Uncharacterized protein n=1 Tax=Heligmosomoides polygyrus TaxID=6339 RepID=A0A183FRK6_HELPZ|nr:unnamed protein product [Heligmosomoides polygyrus]
MRDTELLPNDIVSDAMRMTPAVQRSIFVSMTLRLNFLGHRSTLRAVHSYWPDDCSVDLRLKALWYLLVAEHASQRAPLGASCTHAWIHFDHQFADGCHCCLRYLKTAVRRSLMPLTLKEPE